MPHNVTLVPKKQVIFHTLHNKPTLSGLDALCVLSCSNVISVHCSCHPRLTKWQPSQTTPNTETRRLQDLWQSVHWPSWPSPIHTDIGTRQKQTTRRSPIFGIKFDKNIHIAVPVSSGKPFKQLHTPTTLTVEIDANWVKCVFRSFLLNFLLSSRVRICWIHGDPHSNTYFLCETHIKAASV